MTSLTLLSLFFFFNDTATTEIYTLSLHDALPISTKKVVTKKFAGTAFQADRWGPLQVTIVVRKTTTITGTRRKVTRKITATDRKSTRLNSSHVRISYADFCLKKKKKWYEQDASQT